MRSGLVSVLMPALNEAEHIEAAIVSVLDQRDVDIEVLVIDGRSFDRTREIVGRLAEQDARVKLLDNPRTNISAGLNVGLAHAKGEFVARVDAHSSISPGYLACGVERLRQDASLASVGGRREGVSSSPKGRSVALALSSRFGVGDSIIHYGNEYQYTDHASFAATRTDAARAVGGWDEGILVSEDVEFDHRLLLAGHRIGFDPQMQVSWQVRPTPRQLMRQYRRYGRGKAATVRKGGRAAMKWRYLAPPALVVGMTGIIIAELVKPILLVLLVPYAALLVVATLRSWRRRPKAESVAMWALPLAFMGMHFGWGVGFIEGMLFKKSPALASGSARLAVLQPQEVFDGEEPGRRAQSAGA